MAKSRTNATDRAIKRILELRRSRMRLDQVASHLNAEGIPTRRPGTVWCGSTVCAAEQELEFRVPLPPPPAISMEELTFLNNSVKEAMNRQQGEGKPFTQGDVYLEITKAKQLYLKYRYWNDEDTLRLRTLGVIWLHEEGPLPPSAAICTSPGPTLSAQGVLIDHIEGLHEEDTLRLRGLGVIW